MADKKPLNFAEALATRYEDIEKPPLPPLGTYNFQIKSYKPDTRGDYETLDFQVTAISATDEVDSDELAAYGPVTGISTRLTFMFDKNDPNRFAQTLDRLKTFLGDHVGCYSDGQALKEGLANSLGGVFSASTRYRPNKDDPEIQYFEIDRTAPAA